jgi:hypothetical protein
MDVQVKTPAGTTEVFYRIDPAVAAMLCAVFPDKFSQHAPQHAPVAKPEPIWSVQRTNYGSGLPYICFSNGKDRVERFHGKPEDASATFRKTGLECPAHIVKEYEKVTGGQGSDWSIKASVNVQRAAEQLR